MGAAPNTLALRSPAGSTSVLGPRPTGRTLTGVVALGAGAFFGHVVWPCTALLLARATASRQGPALQAPSRHDVDAFATVVIPAYREASTIGRAVVNLLQAEKTPVAEVVVVADDDERTAAAAEAAGARVVTGRGRGGKSGAINRGVAHATSDVVVLMDANTEIDVDDVRRLAEHVRSDRLDLAGGVRTEHGDGGQGFYWRFENLTKAAEHRLGGCLSLVGEAVAFHRNKFRPIPEWVRGDDTYMAMDFAERGLRVSVDTEVVASEPSVLPSDQFERRIRIMAANLELLWRRRESYLTPSRAMLMYHAHKTWRSTGGPICQIALTGWALKHPKSPLALAWIGISAFSAADYVSSSVTDRKQGTVRSIISQALGMPPVVLVGAVWRLARSRRRPTDGTWNKIER